MRRIIIVLVFIQLSFLLGLKAQDTMAFKPKHMLGIYTGYSYHVIRDDIMSPLIYNGTQIPVEIGYSCLGKKYIHTFSIFYDKLTLKSSISDSYYAPYTNNINILLNYSYNRKIYSIHKFNIYIGSKLIGEINYRDHYYNNYNNAINADALASIGINVLLLKRFVNFKNDYIFFNFSMPFLGYSYFNNRYNANVNMSKGVFVTMDKLVEFQTKLSYTKFVNKHVGFEITHNFHFYSLAEYSNLFQSRCMNNQLLLGLIIKL